MAMARARSRDEYTRSCSVGKHLRVFIVKRDIEGYIQFLCAEESDALTKERIFTER